MDEALHGEDATASFAVEIGGKDEGKGPDQNARLGPPARETQPSRMALQNCFSLSRAESGSLTKSQHDRFNGGELGSVDAVGHGDTLRSNPVDTFLCTCSNTAFHPCSAV